MELFAVIDQNLLFWIQNNVVTSTLTPYMLLLSNIGNIGLIWIVWAIFLLCIKEYRMTGIAVLLGLLISLILGNGILKPSLARLRPYIIYSWMSPDIVIPLPTDYSFPSGHTFGSFSAATIIFCRNKHWGIFALILALGIGFSRVYLFLHYPSDILGGMLLGILCGIFTYKIICYVLISPPWHKNKQKMN
ncbi:MAG: phosphatase PAP2 family protein [Megasphaera sp.]|uniref:phosphatase PAP2 family protein n=1 Tax=Megasphaera sueciensis TaxID=349094 RepID=UPI003D03FF43|nr:phosphatase PAP2 family protein [Megasphaera sp.]MCI1823767.1 phosphatase PAP2 family protein [Megasphaera sp.]